MNDIILFCRSDRFWICQNVLICSNCLNPPINLAILNLKYTAKFLISGIAEKEVIQAWKNAKDREESNDLSFEGLESRTLINQNNLWSPGGRT